MSPFSPQFTVFRLDIFLRKNCAHQSRFWTAVLFTLVVIFGGRPHVFSQYVAQSLPLFPEITNSNTDDNVVVVAEAPIPGTVGRSVIRPQQFVTSNVGDSPTSALSTAAKYPPTAVPPPVLSLLAAKPADTNDISSLARSTSGENSTPSPPLQQPALQQPTSQPLSVVYLQPANQQTIPQPAVQGYIITPQGYLPVPPAGYLPAGTQPVPNYPPYGAGIYGYNPYSPPPMMGYPPPMYPPYGYPPSYGYPPINGYPQNSSGSAGGPPPGYPQPYPSPPYPYSQVSYTPPVPFGSDPSMYHNGYGNGYGNGGENGGNGNNPNGGGSDGTGGGNTGSAPSTLSSLMPVKITSPLLETTSSTLGVMNPFNAPTEKDRGIGGPLVNSSWLSRPKYVGLQVGILGGSQLITNMIDQKSSGIVSLTYGKYVHHYWGYEARLSYAALALRDTEYAQDQYALFHLGSSGYVPPLVERSNRIVMGDIAVHYYPLGDARWRPFFKLGVGVVSQKFTDTFGADHSPLTISLPVGAGLRYWWNEQIALNMELADNILFQSSVAKTQHDVSFMVGVTYSFGRSSSYKPTTYWPYNPSMKY